MQSCQCPDHRVPVTLWALRFLTLAILVSLALVAGRFIEKRMCMARRGERVLTASALRGLLLAGLGFGLLLRIVGWDDGHEGVVAWIGGIMMLASIVGLIILGFVKERARASDSSFYFNPNWKYGLLVICIATITIQSLVSPEGAASSLNVWLFVLALIGLVVQTVGRCIRHRRFAGLGAPVDPNR